MKSSQYQIVTSVAQDVFGTALPERLQCDVTESASKSFAFGRAQTV